MADHGSLGVGLVSRNPDDAVAFYGGVLGLTFGPPEPVPGSTGELRRAVVGAATLKVLGPADALPVMLNADGGRSALRYLTVPVADANTAFDSCRRAGCKVVMEPRRVRPGVTIAFVHDFEGNLVELMESVPDGSVAG